MPMVFEETKKYLIPKILGTKQVISKNIMFAYFTNFTNGFLYPSFLSLQALGQLL